MGEAARPGGEARTTSYAAAPEETLRALAARGGLPFVPAGELAETLPRLPSLSPKYLRHYVACPIAVDGASVTVATADPANALLLDDLRQQLGPGVRLCVAPAEAILEAIERTYGGGSALLLRGGIVPGGVGHDLPAGLDLPGELEAALRDFDEIVGLALENTLVMDRLDDTGRLTTRTARDHGALGYVARASGIDADVRRDHPFAAYGALEVRVPVFESGDVKARTLVRVEEARESVRLIREAVRRLPAGPLAAPLGALPPFAPAFGVVEGWRGAVVHWVMADAAGRLDRVKIMDPSFLNWRPLSYALLKNIVPDFPLCNKSFNQSYSGNDL